MHKDERNIPAAVKREVRKACGFCCVICEKLVVQYDHFDKPFYVASEHDPNGLHCFAGAVMMRLHEDLLSGGGWQRQTRPGDDW